MQVELLVVLNVNVAKRKGREVIDVLEKKNNNNNEVRGKYCNHCEDIPSPIQVVEGSLRNEGWVTVTGEKKEQEVANGPKRLNVLSQDFVAEC